MLQFDRQFLRYNAIRQFIGWVRASFPHHPNVLLLARGNDALLWKYREQIARSQHGLFAKLIHIPRAHADLKRDAVRRFVLHTKARRNCKAFWLYRCRNRYEGETMAFSRDQ